MVSHGLWTEVVKLVFMFTGIGIAAYDFLCPNLHLLSLHTGLSEQVIGATFIAFGNASVDIFSAFASLHTDNASLALGSVIGAAFFIICVVIGALAIAQPCKVVPKAFLRDSCFLIVATTLVLFVVADGRITVWESFALIVLYAIYAVIVINTEHRDPLYVHLHGELEPTIPSLYDAVEHWGEVPEAARENAATEDAAESANEPGSNGTNIRLQVPKLLPGSASQKSIASSLSSICEPRSISDHLFPAFVDWKTKSWLQRANTALVSPVLLALQLSIPVPLDDDNRKLNSIYCVGASCVIFALVLPWTWGYALGMAAIAAAGAAAAQYVPINTTLLAASGFAMAVMWILFLASQVVEVVQKLGEAFGVSRALLGLTVVAIGNSLGDLVSNISIARSDHPEMALSACFGSPLLLILIGLGGSSCVEMLLSGKHVIYVDSSASIMVTCCLLIVTLLALLVYLPINGWHVGPRVGAACISVWVANVVFNLLMTFEYLF